MLSARHFIKRVLGCPHPACTLRENAVRTSVEPIYRVVRVSALIPVFRLLVGVMVLAPAGTSAALAVDAELQGNLNSSDYEQGDEFGVSVSLDGETALVGAWGDQDAGPWTGSAYVFRLEGETWIEEAKLTASDASCGAIFGTSVSLDGETALIGAPEEGSDTCGGGRLGSAYVFVRSGNTWTQQAKLTGSDAAMGDGFGISVSVYGDTALVGAWNGCEGACQPEGAAYVFVRNGTTWTQEAKLISSDGEEYDIFGHSVSLDMDAALVGAYIDNEPDDPQPRRVSAYVFRRTGGTWFEEAKLLAGEDEENSPSLWSDFSRQVSLDGDTVLVGSRGDSKAGERTGAVYVFTRSGGTWTLQTRLTPKDGVEGQEFGASVSLDGKAALVGSGGWPPRWGAWVFLRSGSTWSQVLRLRSSDPVAHGAAVSLGGRLALVGAPEYCIPCTGAAYVYDVTTPAELIIALKDTTISLELPQGIERSLLAKLEVAVKMFQDVNEMNDVVAIHSLQAFVHDVEAQHGNGIAEDDAGALLAAAEEILALLN
jgi:hypothetical protein